MAYTTNKGLIFNIQRFSIHDGPGIRTTVFFKGCQLACKWCSNPESMKNYPEIMTHNIKCILCGRCEDVCRVGAIKIKGNKRYIDSELCDQCLECANVCPSKAIEVVGNYQNLEETFAEAIKDRLFYRNSGGGVTVSGGEPLMQWKFLQGFLEKCQGAGLHTALDTTGYVPWKIFEKVLKHVDLVLYDVKHMNMNSHKINTGLGNVRIKNNLVKLSGKKTVWVRFPLIPAFNDDDANMHKMGEFVSSLEIEKLSILPYHRLGIHKYEQLPDRAYDLTDIELTSDDWVESRKEILESYGLDVSVGN